MLDRYGIGYICRHPEILFTRPSGLGAHFHNDGTERHYRPEDLLDRMAEAYRMLNEIYDLPPAANGQENAGRPLSYQRPSNCPY